MTGDRNGVGLWRSSLLSQFPELRHGVSLRLGGVSPAPFDSLNVGFHVGDDPANVLTNRERVASAVGVPLDAWVCAQQVHGDRVRCATEDDVGRGARDYDAAIPETDALVTDVPGATLTVFVADCAPVFLYDPAHRAIGLAHAGWRSLAAGIVPRTVREMQARFGTQPEHLVTAVGPSLGPCCFEIGPEVAAQFDAAHLREHPQTGKPHLDPWSAIRAQLQEIGVPRDRINASPPCTMCDSSRHFSYRASGGETGRMVAVMSA